MRFDGGGGGGGGVRVLFASAWWGVRVLGERARALLARERKRAGRDRSCNESSNYFHRPTLGSATRTLFVYFLHFLLLPTAITIISLSV